MGILSSITDWIDKVTSYDSSSYTSPIETASKYTEYAGAVSYPETSVSVMDDAAANAYTATRDSEAGTTSSTSTTTPTVSTGSSSNNNSSSSGSSGSSSSSSYWDELQAAIQAAYDNGAAVAQTNLNNQLSSGDLAYAQATNPYGVAAENLQALGLSTDGGFSNMQQMANLASKANLDASAFSDYNSVMADLAAAKSVSEIEAIYSALENEERSYWNEYYAQLNEETNAASTYSSNLEEAMTLVSLNPDFDVYSYMIAKGLSETDAKNIATAAAAGTASLY